MKNENSSKRPPVRSMSPKEELQIANDFQRGTPEAVQRVREGVRRILASRGYRIPVSDKEDLEQEIMTQIWQAANLSGFEAGDRFWGFVQVVTARRCIDWLRSRYRDARLAPLPDEVAEVSAGPLVGVMEIERSELIHRTLARIAKPCRDLIYLHFGLEKSYRELAGLLGKSEGSLRVQMFRCIRSARGVLEELKNEQTEEKDSRAERHT